MKLTPQQADKLLRGDHKFAQLSFSMMLTRLKTKYSKDPSSLYAATAEINAFLEKFRGIMGNDMAIITRL
jgi:hypothetical protein